MNEFEHIQWNFFWKGAKDKKEVALHKNEYNKVTLDKNEFENPLPKPSKYINKGWNLIGAIQPKTTDFGKIKVSNF